MTSFKFGILSCLILTGMRAFEKWHFSRQEKIIVYNVPSHRAIDFVSGNRYRFVGDDDLARDGLLQTFHLKPSRISLMLTAKDDGGMDLYRSNNFYQFHNKRILIIDSAIVYIPAAERMHVDYIIISKNPKIVMPRLAAVFNCNHYVFDASNPLWKIAKWKKDCEDLHLPFHSVPEQGAFVTDH